MATNNIQGSPSFWRNCKYDVFISFRGPDTRNGFVDHLYNHLIRKGIFAFKDDERLEKRESIPSELKQAIKGSRISIVVFSKGYADSEWCLEEMAMIAECKKELKQKVFTVFYDVEPFHVRKQYGVYKNAFVSHTQKFIENQGKVDRWKSAMTEFANLGGWHISNSEESSVIAGIVQEVIKELDHKFSGIANDLIGIQSRVEGLEKLLKLSSADDDFRILGIWGMSGIGKTTLATVLYDKISYQFEACCFIENVDKTYKDGGAMAVQNQILRQTLDEKNLKTYSPLEISGILRNRLHNMKVLVVLDNVDHLEQLTELKIEPKLLKAGSRMIITTRDEHILRVYEADEIHNVPLMNDGDARKLFCRKAFKSGYPEKRYEELIPKILKYAQCLPLAIRVLGSFLYQRPDTQWRAALRRLEEDVDDKIMDVLQLSYEGLEETNKEIFLYIACFFKGERRDYVSRILDCYSLSPGTGIPNLVEKSLITIQNQEIHMHKMLQKLGKKIVREQFPQKPGWWSRLWLHEDFCHVMNSQTGTNNVEAIVLDQKADASKYLELDPGVFSKMKSLKLLILHKNFSGNLDFLSNSLRYLTWHGYPSDSLPPSFRPDILVELNMPNGNFKRLWAGIQCLPSLRRMDLSNSKYLEETPNFEEIRNLERLDLTGCTNLLLVHSSIGLLRKLACLSLRNCSNLVGIDFGTKCELLSLRVLQLSGCTKLESTPDISVHTRDCLIRSACASLETGEGSQVCRLPFNYLHESRGSSGPKIQLPYNRLVTDEEECNMIQAKAKENNLSNVGFTSSHDEEDILSSSRPKLTYIEGITQMVMGGLGHKFSWSSDYLVGIQPHVEYLERLLKLSSEDDDFRVLGICGMDGIGKTTHALVLYDRIFDQFDAACFIENVSQIYRDGGATAVQKQILHQTLNQQIPEIYSSFEISGFIRKGLSPNRVLIVLDNVDEIEQLEKLGISPRLLGRGSRIIVITRDECILKMYGADEIHKVALLSYNDAHELFLKAFNSDSLSDNNCVELIPKILEYAQGLPLAIRVMGSLLRGQDYCQWKDALGRPPDQKIMDVLQTSFEDLRPNEKEIFLHVACFFHGKTEEYVKRILDSCGLYSHIGIHIIMEKSLITIKDKKIHMHKMLQEFGREFVRGKHPEEPELWSRLWHYKDFKNVLMSKKETNNVKAIVLDRKEDMSKGDELRIERLSKMRDLKLLVLNHENFSGRLEYLSNNLRYLLWHSYPFSSLPSFEPYSRLIELNLPKSSIKQLWEGRKNFPYLERVDLSNSKNLTETPNFEGSPSLRWLDLTGCTNLRLVNPSIGLLTKLVYLSLQECAHVVNFDLGTECKLSSLEVLCLSGCKSLEKTPDFTGLSNLKSLDLEQCISLSAVHESIGTLSTLEFLSLRGCTSLVEIPNNVNIMTSLKL